MINFKRRNRSCFSDRLKKSILPSHFSPFLSGLFLGLFLLGFSAINAPAAAFTYETHYEEAVPGFLETISQEAENVIDQQELDHIAQWEEDVRKKLPEFLDDLILIASQLEEDGNNEFILEEYQGFADQWNDLIQTYPGLSELEPIVAPIINQLLAGLPTLQSTPNENPVQNFVDLYSEMIALNPWGIGAFWRIPVSDNTMKVAEKVELSHEQTTKGYKNIDIIRRNIYVALNGDVVYSEYIKDDELQSKSVLLRDPSILHETLNQMLHNGEDPEHISIVRELSDLVNTNLKLALKKGVIDDCSLGYMLRKKLFGVKNNCVDISGNLRRFSEIVKFDPFDHVNQVKLSYVDPMTELTMPVTQVSEDPHAPTPLVSITNELPPINNPSAPVNPWVFGAVLPALWSASGFIRLF